MNSTLNLGLHLPSDSPSVEEGCGPQPLRELTLDIGADGGVDRAARALIAIRYETELGTPGLVVTGHWSLIA